VITAIFADWKRRRALCVKYQIDRHDVIIATLVSDAFYATITIVCG
jgi:hypothetical protein